MAPQRTANLRLASDLDVDLRGPLVESEHLDGERTAFAGPEAWHVVVAVVGIAECAEVLPARIQVGRSDLDHPEAPLEDTCARHVALDGSQLYPDGVDMGTAGAACGTGWCLGLIRPTATTISTTTATRATWPRWIQRRG